ncbi:hypothetical protein Cgig2_000358 [Carnegiea gigantea]|uniref:Endonuclease/exonuclease/phosphatase domain-containing protein n=1 Tax=Carnegiea gigantea TaxID=171969 RepID=A0A9Q1QBJ3_9CARY|nr:hypothetical protein Cgig2_000358 [Carnegiea gigantea]
MLGILIKTDKYTKEKLMLKYARLLVEMPLGGNFLDFIEFANEKNVVIRQKVIYEWLPIKCSYCKMYGHSQENCRKKTQPRQEWRVITHNTPQEHSSPPDQTPSKGGGDDFQLATWHITRQTASRATDLFAPDDLLQVNLYNALLDEDVILDQGGESGYDRFLETKVKEQNIDHVMNRICPNWQWRHNATRTERGRIILCWHLRRYRFSLISMTDQLLYREATHLPTGKNFHITFIYGRNLVDQRLPLWKGLKAISQSMDDPWCVLGDFNSILHQGDRIRGIDVTDGEIKDFTACIQHCGAFFTWTNKQIWSRIDRALHNGFWYACHDFTHMHYLPQALSDHTPIILSFSHCPKPRYTFLFCDMWANDRGFKDIVKTCLTQNQNGSKLRQLQQLSKSRYADIYEQQLRARSQLLQVQSLLQQDPSNEASSRDHYIAINHSAMLLIKQQSKAEWIGYGDECSRVFMARIKQRKALSSIYHMKDLKDQRVEGFIEVSRYYKGLLGARETQRTPIDPHAQVFIIPQVVVSQAIAKRKDHLWIHWIHGRYLRERESGGNIPLKVTHNLNLNKDGKEAFIISLRNLKMPKRLRSLIQVMTNAVIYHIWQARNKLFFKNEPHSVHSILKEIKAQILDRVLQIHQHRHKYTTCIDFLLLRK